MTFSTWPNRSLLTLVFGATLVSIVIAAGTEYWGLAHLKGALSIGGRSDLAMLESVEGMQDDLLQLRRYEKDVFINIGAPTVYTAYRLKWDRAFTRVRYDLVRARAAAPPFAELRLQGIADAIAEYRTSFEETFALIKGRSLLTAQQANESMRKESVRRAEGALAQIEREARQRTAQFGPVLDAQRFGIALNLLMLVGIVALFVFCTRHVALERHARG